MQPCTSLPSILLSSNMPTRIEFRYPVTATPSPQSSVSEVANPTTQTPHLIPPIKAAPSPKRKRRGRSKKTADVAQEVVSVANPIAVVLQAPPAVTLQLRRSPRKRRRMSETQTSYVASNEEQVVQPSKVEESLGVAIVYATNPPDMVLQAPMVGP